MSDERVTEKLPWREARVSDKWERYSAESVFGNYEALEWSNGGYGGTLAPASEDARGVEFDATSIDHAKSICEADYAVRLAAFGLASTPHMN